MGRNLEKEAGFFSFGMRARNEEFVPPPTLHFFCVHLNFLHKSYFIKSQQLMKKAIDNPSGPGALSGSKPQTASFTSDSLISLTRSALFAMVTYKGISAIKSSVSCGIPPFYSEKIDFK